MQHQDSGQQSTALVPLRSATHSRGQGAAVLQQVSVPVEHCGTFGELFAWLLCQGMLCCGLYRQATFGGTPLSYVYTNPHKVRPNDALHGGTTNLHVALFVVAFT